MRHDWLHQKIDVSNISLCHKVGHSGIDMLRSRSAKLERKQPARKKELTETTLLYRIRCSDGTNLKLMK